MRSRSSTARLSKTSRAITSANSADSKDTNEFTDAIKSYLETSHMPSSLLKQIEARQDIPTTAVGPNPTRQAQLALVAARRKALMWLEQQAALTKSLLQSSMNHPASAGTKLSAGSTKSRLPSAIERRASELLMKPRSADLSDTSNPGGLKRPTLSELAELALNRELPLPPTSETFIRAQTTSSGEIQITRIPLISSVDSAPPPTPKTKDKNQPFIPRKRESLSSACRRKIQDWTNKVTSSGPAVFLTAEGVQFQKEASTQFTSTSIMISTHDSNGHLLEQTRSLHGVVPKPSGTKSLHEHFEKTEEQERLEALMKIQPVTAMFFADRNAHLSASCIGLSDIELRQMIKWEKKRVMDLREKERIVPKYYAMQKSANEMVLLIKRATAQKTSLQKELEIKRKTREAVDTVLVEIFALHKRFQERLQESERHAFVEPQALGQSMRSRRRRKLSNQQGDKKFTNPLNNSIFEVPESISYDKLSHSLNQS